MPRASTRDQQGFLTSTRVAAVLGITRFVLMARIADGTLPAPSRITENGTALFAPEWVSDARTSLSGGTELRRRARRGTRGNTVPTVEAVLGHTPGEDGWIPTWDEVRTWFHALANASDRVIVEEPGTSTDGRPYLVVSVSAPSNLTDAARQQNREDLERLRDPRSSSDEQRATAIDRARTIGVVLAAQHSNEFGSLLMTMQLAYDLAVASDDDTLALLDSTIAILIPSHNPDGIDLIGSWYRRWRGTEHDGVEMPWLYHPYVGHDNNRDWFMMTQPETRLYVDMHNRECPQAVFDMHQMGRFGPRFMVPPFIDPLDPNQDPLIQQGFTALGSHIAQRLTAEDKPGVVINAIFDNYSPSLAYGNYHGSVDLLSEAASSKLASPVTLGKKDLNDEYGVDPTARLWNQPLPWEAGDWGIGDIVAYNIIAARSFLDHLARNRRQWLKDYARLHVRLVNPENGPRAFVIPPGQRDPRASMEMLDILQRGMVEVEVATGEIELDGMTFPVGSYVIRTGQPAGAFARTLLDIQQYPDVRRWKDAPPQPPYDIVGHTLPVLMGVHCVAITGDVPESLPLERVGNAISPTGSIETGAPEHTAWVIDGRSNASIAAINVLQAEGIRFGRVQKRADDPVLVPGDVVVRKDAVAQERMAAIAESTGAMVRDASVPHDTAVWTQARVRLAVYQPWTASIDEGWARWVLGEYGYQFETIHLNDLRQGNLRDRFDVVIIPDMTTSEFLDGRKKLSRDGDPYPPEYLGGLGEAGKHALRVFTDAGGSLIVIDRASAGVIDALALPVSLPLAGLDRAEFSCPGSLLRIVVDHAHPLGLGMPRESAALFLDSTVFASGDPSVTTVARYPQGNPLLSGWIHGADRMAGAGALLDVAYGDGHVVLVGFRPYFRAQARNTYRIVFNAINRAAFAETTFGQFD